jgi:DNA-binding NarL/FixJ family response regulator
METPGEPTGAVTVAVANDYELVVAGLAAMLAPFEHAVTVRDAILIGDPVDEPVDVVLYDTFGRADQGMVAIEKLCGQPNVGRVAVYTTVTEPRLAAVAIDRGAAGVLSKATPAGRLVEDIRRIAMGERIVHQRAEDAMGAGWPGQDLGLSPRQAEIMALVLDGLRNQEIADALFVEVNTIKTHLRKAYAALGVRNRAEAAALLLRGQWFARRERSTG